MEAPETMEMDLVQVRSHNAAEAAGIKCWHCGSHDLAPVTRSRPVYAPNTTTLMCKNCAKTTDVLTPGFFRSESTTAKATVKAGTRMRNASLNVCLVSA